MLHRRDQVETPMSPEQHDMHQKRQTEDTKKHDICSVAHRVRLSRLRGVCSSRSQLLFGFVLPNPWPFVRAELHRTMQGYFHRQMVHVERLRGDLDTAMLRVYRFCGTCCSGCSQEHGYKTAAGTSHWTLNTYSLVMAMMLCCTNAAYHKGCHASFAEYRLDVFAVTCAITLLRVNLNAERLDHACHSNLQFCQSGRFVLAIQNLEQKHVW
jgi:hypothetical protein